MRQQRNHKLIALNTHNIQGIVFLCLGLFFFLALWPYTTHAKPELPNPPKDAPPTARMTMLRLDPPPMPANPTQADQGAHLFWLHCQPCHGDQGQGLTADWRSQYPPEEQNCWQSGCHGQQNRNPNAFLLPALVPGVIGANTLQRFGTAADLHSYLHQAMPYQTPGTLAPQEYWAITAFLLARRGLPAAGLPLSDRSQAEQITLHPLQWSPAAVMALPRANLLWLSVGTGVLLVGGLVLVGWKRKGR